jgi:hypothetical protein
MPTQPLDPRVYQLMARPNGFENKDDVVLSFDDGTRTFSATYQPSGASIWVDGLQVVKSGETVDSVQIPDTEGLHFIYYDDEGLKVAQTFTEDMILRWCFTSVVYWDTDNQACLILADERHSCYMNSRTHLYNHLTGGARYASGFAVTPGRVDGNGDEDIDAQISVEGGVWFDEDIRFDVVDGSPQTLSPVAQIPIFYRLGSEGNWRKDASTGFITKLGTSRAVWNEFTGSEWVLTDATQLDLVNMHLFATPDINEPLILIMGQAEYNSPALAREGILTEIRNIQFGNLTELLVEAVPIASFMMQTSTGYDNPVASRMIETITNEENFVDWRYPRLGQGLFGL